MTPLVSIHEDRSWRLTFWYSFLMAFPAILIVQNVSIFVFPFLVFSFYSLSGRVITLRYAIQFVALVFALGAILSVVYIPDSMPALSLGKALEVLPNYLYWVILILVLTSQRHLIRLDAVYRGVFWGVLCSVFYFFALQDYLIAFQLFKLLTQNTFAFLLICYTPIVIWYTWNRFGFWGALLMLVILTVSGFLSGSRSGSLLTLSGGAFTLLFNRKSTASIYIIFLVGYFIMSSVIDNDAVKNLVRNLNSRTYDLIYNRKKTLEEDRSYLTRLAQIEKSVLIFEKYPWHGIGLNNFTNYRTKLPGNFEGAKYVVDKKNIDNKSAHNSYFGFLAEGGLFLVIPFLVILVYCIVWYLLSMRKLLPEYQPIFIGIIHMSVHLYFIYAILNVFAWFLIGLGCWAIVKHKA